MNVDGKYTPSRNLGTSSRNVKVRSRHQALESSTNSDK